jgi:hypothetical protein
VLGCVGLQWDGELAGLVCKFKSETSLFRKLIQRLDLQLRQHEEIPAYTPSINMCADSSLTLTLHARILSRRRVLDC